jgi:cyclopropane fatty-acyl-phospholipid synthase-like methyltransferase
MLIRVGRAAARRVLKKFRGMSLAEAQAYTGTDRVSGRLQMEVLQREGCMPGSHVLEVGCGCLSAGLHLIEWLDADRYVGIDPNPKLREAALKDPNSRQLVERKRARFLSNTEFDASSLGTKFEYVLSHSILSHAAHWQLPLYLKNTAKCLAPGGRIVASIRLAEGNEFGSPGTPDKKDSMDEAWVYPTKEDPAGVSWFSWATVVRQAEAFQLEARVVPDYTKFYTETRPREIHDWVVFTRKAS